MAASLVRHALEVTKGSWFDTQVRQPVIATLHCLMQRSINTEPRIELSVWESG